MSTQHPDNVNPPFFAENAELAGEDEIQEAYYAFCHLGCDEQMWDCEGKEVDTYVIKKLLAKYGSFFSEKKLGNDLFITLRVPNPTIERAEAKVLLETLESIPRSFDAAKLFYQDDTPPIFEVILPMTTSSKCIDRVYRYYSDFVIGKENKSFKQGDITIADWIGEFKPERINVIPLFEDMEHMLNADSIVREYLQDKDVEYQRVFLARSDPALNYGLVGAVLLNKIVLQRLQNLSKEIGTQIYPIIGVGSSPFRGNFKPLTVERVAEEYPGTHTFTIQSSFKYDNPADKVREAVNKLKGNFLSAKGGVNEERCLEIIGKCSKEYRRQITRLAPIINKIAGYIPNRRKRKLHIGLFGYSRNVEGINLPRAIKFTAALYSIGLPPEILGLNALNEKDLEFVRETYIHFDDDLKDALRYFNPASPVPAELKDKIKDITSHQIDEKHKEITDCILKGKGIKENVLRAAHLRGFLG